VQALTFCPKTDPGEIEFSNLKIGYTQGELNAKEDKDYEDVMNFEG
jgi:hypothetical protein